MTDVVPAAEVLTPEIVAWKTAQRISRTEFVPTSFRNRPEAVFAAILFGRELGMGPLQSVNSIWVIQGTPTLKPQAMRARVLAHGHKIETTAYTDQRVTLVGTRGDNGSTEKVSWTLADAERAGIDEKENWRTYPRAMLLARATSELCRLLFPDVIAGVSYTPEELGDAAPPDEDPDVIDVPCEVDVETGEIVEVAE